MADKDEQQETASMIAEESLPIKIVDGKKYQATLVNGENYFIGDLRFQKNVPVVVTSEVAKRLQGKHTAQSLMAADETMQPFKRRRFIIKEVPVGVAAAKPQVTRTRHRVSE